MYYHNIECTIDCSSGNAHAQILIIMIFKRLSKKNVSRKIWEVDIL